MKLLIASDIHGSAAAVNLLAKRCRAEAPDRLLLLGDLLYHGPRNALPDKYGPAGAAEGLNALKDLALCVRGNCDAEVDALMLRFPIMAEYAYICDDYAKIFATHGHIHGPDNPPALAPGDILLCGHTHVSACEKKDGFLYLNPGSAAIPKGGTPAGYMTYEKGVFLWKTLAGEIYREHRL